MALAPTREWAAIPPVGRTVERVTTSIGASHTWIGDLTIKLRSPSGTILTLLNRPGSTAADNGAESPVGDSSNWAGSVLTFGDGLGPEAELMGGSLTIDQNICINDGVCAHDPSPDMAVQPPPPSALFVAPTPSAPGRSARGIQSN